MARSIRFGVWAPVHGSRAALQDPEEPFDASWARTRRLVLEAEALGFDSVLLAQHTMNPNGDDLAQLEAWTAAAALAEAARRIEVVAAIKPLLYHPVTLAKLALGIEEISGGRFAINLVNAWNRLELERAGIPFPAHDERYAYGREWLAVVEALMRGEAVRHRGPHFSVQDYRLHPHGLFRDRPAIYVGGESEPARALVAALGDLWFINGQPLSKVAALIEDAAARPRAGAPLRFGLSAFVIARPMAAQADEAFARLLDLAAQDAPIRARQKAHTDPDVVMKHVMAQSRAVGTNGGTAAGLVGSYDEVARRVADFHAAGIELFMLQFQPFEAEMRRFAAEVAPRARRLSGA